MKNNLLIKPGAELEYYTDAPKFEFRAILLQKSKDGKIHPILYMSKKTSVTEEKYCSYDLEVLETVEDLRMFRNCLLGSKFKIYTDCPAFSKVLSKREIKPKVDKYSFFQLELDYYIVHKQMRYINALSRYLVIAINRHEKKQKIIAAQENDEFIEIVKNHLK